MSESQTPTITSKDSHLTRVLVEGARHERVDGVVEQRDDVNDDVLNDPDFQKSSRWSNGMETMTGVFSRTGKDERVKITYIPPGARLSEQLHDVVVDDVGALAVPAT